MARRSLAVFRRMSRWILVLLLALLAGGFTAAARAQTSMPTASPADLWLWGDPMDERAAPVKEAWADDGLRRTASPKSLAPANVRWALLRCAFPGGPEYPRTAEQTLRVFTKPEVGLLAYFERQAQGRTQMSVAWVQEVTLPRSRDGYWGQSTSTSAFIAQATNDCLRLVAAQRSLDDITGMAVYFNDNVDCCAYGSPYTMTLPNGDTRRVPAIWLPPAAHTQPLVIAHELAHGFAVPHSNNADLDFDVTDNAWDLMSNIKINRQVDEEIGPLPRGFHAYHRHTLGWLDANEVTDIQVADGDDRTIETVLGPNSLLRLHFTSDTGLTVTFRRANHPDEGERTQPAVFIDELVTWRNQPLWVVDEALPVPTVANTASSYFTAGESWALEEAAPGRAVLVEVVSVSSDAAVVRVHLGPPPPPINVFRDAFESLFY